MYKDRDCIFPAYPNYVGGTVHVDALVIGRVTPNAGFASRVDDGFTAFGRGQQVVVISDVARRRGDAVRFQVLRRAALKGDDLVVQFYELAANRASKKSTAASDQDFQKDNSLVLHFFRSPLSQFFAPDLGIVPDIHRETRVEQNGSNAPGDGVGLGELQKIEMHTFGIDR